MKDTDLLDRLAEVCDEINALANRVESQHDAEPEACNSLLDLCADCEQALYRVRRAASERQRVRRTEPASLQRMTSFIVAHLQQPEKEEPTVRKTRDLPGGVNAAARRRAEGKCELCGAEFRLSPHHIIPRSAGGLDDLDNLIILCASCHDDVEDRDYRTREAVLRHDRRRPRQPERTEEARRTAAEKAAATRAANRIEQQREDEQIAAWDNWPGALKYVPYLPVGAPEPARPEKRWHVIVYGAGRHARNV